jgi:hypothetical protein
LTQERAATFNDSTGRPDRNLKLNPRWFEDSVTTVDMADSNGRLNRGKISLDKSV